MLDALKKQVGGDHYQSDGDPTGRIHSCQRSRPLRSVPLFEYISRWKVKGGVASTSKRRGKCLQILIDYQRQQNAQTPDIGHQAAIAAARAAEAEAKLDAS